jgi:hypothetical protein
MKRCENCFEQNNDGATHCVICGEVLDVAQIDNTAKFVPPIIADPNSIEPKNMLNPACTTIAEGSPTVIIAPDIAESTSVQEAPKEEKLSQVAIEVYHTSEHKVLHTHILINDITLIGREDPERDIFPDLDISKISDVVSSYVSREHLRVLRQGDKFFLYIYHGSTGTQVNKEIIPESQYGKKFEIQLGDRIILNGFVRLKLVAK